LNIPAKIESIEYDPNRSAFIALALYADGERRYILASKSFEVGSQIIASDSSIDVKPGNRTMLKFLPLGTRIYNVETKPNSGAKLVRSAGTGAELTARDAGYAQIRLPSGEVRRVREECYATVGEVSNSEHKLRTVGKAGRKRHMGWRPTVRGTAMNPVDHPMGGGEAKSRGSRKHKKTKWGKVVDPGVKTRRPGKYSDHLIVSRRKNKKRK
jgi:large subunit ribosomal protein L2